MNIADMNTSNRRAWVRSMQSVSKWPAVLLLVLFVLLSGLTDATAGGCDGFSLEAGIGAHERGSSAPEYTAQNPVGIIDLRYTRGPVVFSLSHTSSLEGFPKVWDSPSEQGYGVNMLSVRYRFGP